jgi:FkbM family methyltransferase
MKNIVYRLINKIGYKIENKNKLKKRQTNSLKKFNIEENFELLFKSRKFIDKLENKYPELKIRNHKEGFILSFSLIDIYVESVEEFYIINEVFIEEEYNFSTTDKVVLIDIGTNIGTASLFFSLLKNVEKIYCFEPVLDTYNQAKYNFSINEIAKKVVAINNFGLGNNERDEIFIFDKQVKGNTGVRGKLSSSYTNNVTTKEVSVKIKSASAEIKKIIDSNVASKIVVKMDCEGAEYEIFENLSSEILSQINIFMIEWHDRGSKPLEDILLKNGFNLFLKDLAPNAGIIYASK